MITSAPNHARSCVQVGPDCTCVISRIRIPCSAFSVMTYLVIVFRLAYSGSDRLSYQSIRPPDCTPVCKYSGLFVPGENLRLTNTPTATTGHSGKLCIIYLPRAHPVALSACISTPFCPLNPGKSNRRGKSPNSLVGIVILRHFLQPPGNHFLARLDRRHQEQQQRKHHDWSRNRPLKEHQHRSV